MGLRALGFRVQGVGSGVSGFRGFEGLGFGAFGLRGFAVWGLGFRVQGVGFRVQGLIRIWGVLRIKGFGVLA